MPPRPVWPPAAHEDTSEDAAELVAARSALVRRLQALLRRQGGAGAEAVQAAAFSALTDLLLMFSGGQRSGRAVDAPALAAPGLQPPWAV
jgi:hypothetical protein